MRSTMQALVERLRKLVNDADSSIWWDSDDLQRYLDKRRERANYFPLESEETYAPGGAVSYLTWLAPCGDWEEDAVLTDNSYNVLSPTSSDYENGRWTFTTEPDYPVYVRGWTYDLYAAAADALTERTAQVSEDYTFQADGGYYVRSDKQKMVATTVGKYRALQRGKTVEMYRGDVTI